MSIVNAKWSSVVRSAVEQGQDRRMPAVSLAEAKEGDPGELAHQLEPHDPFVEVTHDLQVVDAQGDLTQGTDGVASSASHSIRRPAEKLCENRSRFAIELPITVHRSTFTSIFRPRSPHQERGRTRSGPRIRGVRRARSPAAGGPRLTAGASLCVMNACRTI